MPAKAGALNARQMSDMVPIRIFTLRILLNHDFRNHDFRFSIVASSWLVPIVNPATPIGAVFYRDFHLDFRGPIQYIATLRSWELHSWELHSFLREPSRQGTVETEI